MGILNDVIPGLGGGSGHSQNTDKTIIDTDSDTALEVEKNADEDKIRGKVNGIECLLAEDPGILTFVKQPAARAYLSANQSINTSTWTKILANSEAYDIQNEYDNATNYRFTATKAGLYLAIGLVTIYQLADGAGVFAAIYKNGGEVVEGRVWVSKVNESATGQIITALSLAAADYLELYIYHTHGSARDALADERYSSFTIFKLT